jgi:hypothetical protein
MDTTNLVNNVTQVANSALVIFNLIIGIVTAAGVAVAAIGRIVHAFKTGNSIKGALIDGTNKPPAGPAPGTLASTVITK